MIGFLLESQCFLLGFCIGVIVGMVIAAVDDWIAK